MTESLAINGGKPVRDQLLPYGSQWIDEEDIEFVCKVLKGRWITQGPKIDEFEKKVAGYCGAKFAVALSSGTAALHAACAVAGISEGDEVITTPITFAADANAVIYNNGTPIFADIREDTLNIDFEEIRKKISNRTKAIIPVDFTGQPCDLDEINAIAQENNLIVIEDAAHALGAEYKSEKIGSLTDMTMFSFHPVKHITTGEGGMILTNNEDFYEKLKIFRHHGITKDSKKLTRNEGPWYYEIQDLGHNFRITDFQCALGISQMDKLDEFIERRRKIAEKYNEAFEEMKGIITPFKLAHVKCAYHIYIIQLKTELLKVGRRKIFEALKAENIGVNVHYVPIHLQPFYKRTYGYKNGDYPVAENYYNRATTLPLFPKMNEKDIEDVIKSVKKVIDYYKL